MGEDLFLAGVHQKVLKALRQADYLSPKYHVVVANPPYVKWKQMNPEMKEFAEAKYEYVKTDLSGIFVDRAISLGGEKSLVSMITMHSWMFLSTLSEFREDLASRRTMLSMAHAGRKGVRDNQWRSCSNNGIRVDYKQS